MCKSQISLNWDKIKEWEKGKDYICSHYHSDGILNVHTDCPYSSENYYYLTENYFIHIWKNNIQTGTKMDSHIVGYFLENVSPIPELCYNHTKIKCDPLLGLISTETEIQQVTGVLIFPFFSDIFPFFKETSEKDISNINSKVHPEVHSNIYSNIQIRSNNRSDAIHIKFNDKTTISGASFVNELLKKVEIRHQYLSAKKELKNIPGELLYESENSCCIPPTWKQKF
jgi:hypothetical protein